MSGPPAAPARAAWPRAVFEAAPVAVAVLDMAGDVLAVNPALAALAGRPGGELVGTSMLALVAPADREDVEGLLSKVVMGIVPAAHLDSVHLNGAPGGGRTVSLRAALIGDADETLTPGLADDEAAAVAVYVLAAADRSDLDEDALQAQKMQALGQLAGGVAHDFNNLLTAIRGFADLMAQRCPAGDTAHADIEQIRANARRGGDLVRQLLAFARRQPHAPVVMAVDAAVGDLTGMLGRLLGETVALDLDLAAAGACVCMDRGHFDQLVVNLAVNARDAMPGGGTLTLTTRGAADVVTIHVADTGVGIPREIMGSIFDPFFTTKEAGAGTGLGLSTVYGIVRQAGGEIAVDSTPGRGTTFTIRLPAAESPRSDRLAESPRSEGAAESPCADAPTAPQAQPPQGATVLLVEDEDAVRLFAARALAARGHTVLEADSGETALDAVAALAGDLDVLVSDVVMPGVDGYTLSRRLRAERPGLKVVLTSGYADESVAPGLADDSGVRFLPKPFTLAELTQTVAAVLVE